MEKFPDGFLWGAAMSAPQTEGYSLEGGKSASTWDYWFATAPEKFNQRQGPDTANLYECYGEDCKRMKELGLNSVRTSISWTRLLPDGKTLNPEAVCFYRNYFKEMLAQDVEPIINLFHFDMPMWLMEKGGWETRASVEEFAVYAKKAFLVFGDLVKKWTTFNEPLVHIECGYLYGYHYPDVVDFKRAIQVGYHTLLAHCEAVKVYRELCPNGQIGLILNLSPSYPESETPEDWFASYRADLLHMRSFLDPAVLGEVPKELTELLQQNKLLPSTYATDVSTIADNTVDFIGVNYYQPRRVKAPSVPRSPAKMPEDFYVSYDWPDKRVNPSRGWEIYPQALYDIAIMMKEKYRNIPWFVSENGMGVAHEHRGLDAKGIVQDDYRIDFMKEHLQVLHLGIAAGSNCFGYHTWTLMDCWSWLNGYRNRYGFYRVNLHNYERTMKKSGLWFKALSENNGFEVTVDEVGRF